MATYPINEFTLDRRVYILINEGIKNGLKDFYSKKENGLFKEYTTKELPLPWIRIMCVNHGIATILKDNPELNIKVDVKKVASYPYILLTSEDHNIKMTICSVNKKGDIPEESEYRGSLATGNGPHNNQLKLFYEEEFEKLPKSLTVTYNGKKGPNPDFIMIGALTPNQKNWIFNLPIEKLISISSESKITRASSLKKKTKRLLGENTFDAEKQANLTPKLKRKDELN